MTMPSGFKATAWLKAEWMPDTLPCPSSTRTVQPIAWPASLTPSPTSWMPPLRWSADT